jgi:hypothetical protein
MGRKMLRIFGSLAVLIFVANITFADEVRVIITKVDGDKVTFAEFKANGEKGLSRSSKARSTRRPRHSNRENRLRTG